ncbi:alpha/beta fold hydrolase [Microbacteriaceae bacterium VKM Ac-2855]|nr:alpha/beta fold hydrolase [Microbacteriaceae bacterium VKM Ac-2855]
MPHLEVPGARLYWEADGPSSASALLLIHAGIANLRMWDPVVAALARDHYVIRFDTRGFGQTASQDAPFSDRTDALDVLDHLGVQRATFIGCSRGGGIAIDVAVSRPDRVAGLVTIGSGPSGFPDVELTDAEDARFDEIDAAFEAGDHHAVARLEAAVWAFGPDRDEAALDPEFVATAYALARANVPHASEHPQPQRLEPPAYDRVVDITVPALVMVGAYDVSDALAAYEYLAETVPTADGYVFLEAAHLPSVERPDEFLAVLQPWLAGHRL